MRRVFQTSQACRYTRALSQRIAERGYTINKTVVEPDWPPAVIAGAFQTGVLALRNLKKHGVRTASFDCNSDLQGFRSSYGPSRLCPDPDLQPKEWLDFMRELSKELGQRPVLIPSSDRFVLAMDRHREALQEFYLLSPGIEIQGQLALKQTQYRLAVQHGMPMPLTRMIDGADDLADFGREAEYPCVLKPWHFREWEHLHASHPLLNKKVAIIEDSAQLAEVYQSVREVTPQLIGQDIIVGPDTNCLVYLSCYARSGERIGNALFRELRCVPMGFGPATVSEPVVDEEADRICNDFLSRLKYHGICEIEVKRDDRDGRVKLIEANPRLSGGGDAAPHDGVNLVWLHYLDMVGEQVTPVGPSGRRFQHIVLREEAVAVPTYMRAGKLTWRELFKSYKPPVAFFDLDFRDWKVSLETLLVFFKVLLKQLFKRR